MNAMQRERLAPSKTWVQNARMRAEQLKTEEIVANRYFVTIETGYSDSEHRIALHLRDRENEWVQASARIFVPDGGEAMLYAAFSIDLLSVALREDVEPQEEAVAALAAVLVRVFGDHAGALSIAMEEAWRRSLTRLEDLWAANAVGEATPARLCLHGCRKRVSLALGGRSTSYNRGGWRGVRLEGGAGGLRCRTVSAGMKHQVATVGTITKEGLAKLPGSKSLSGHDKLRLLAGTSGPEYAAAKAGFDRDRRLLPIRQVMWPGRDRDTFWTQCNILGYTICSVQGDECQVGAERREDREFLKLRFFPGDRSSDLAIRQDIDGSLHFWRWLSRKENSGFASSEALDMALRRTLALWLAWDKRLPEQFLPPDAAMFDPDHPVLAGFAVPPRHQPFVGALLGAPYINADRSGS